MKIRSFFAILAILAIAIASPALADLPPGTDVSIGIEGAGATIGYTTVLGKTIVNTVSVQDLPRATFGHFQSTGMLGLPAGFPPASLATLTYKLDLAYVPGTFSIAGGVGSARYTGTWLFYEPAAGVNLPSYYEKADIDVFFRYNSTYTSAAIDGGWMMEAGTAANPAWDWSMANPYMVINGTWDKISQIGNELTNPYYGQPRINMHVHGAVVPEPGAILLGLGGLGSVAGFMRLRRR
ncbi:MAG: PEP-CTERM sorting domain-containing protein [Armatimonadota bacterium]